MKKINIKYVFSFVILFFVIFSFIEKNMLTADESKFIYQYYDEYSMNNYYSNLSEDAWYQSMVYNYSNGSYKLNNELIILVPEDLEAYYNGTLIFFFRDEQYEIL